MPRQGAASSASVLRSASKSGNPRSGGQPSAPLRRAGRRDRDDDPPLRFEEQDSGIAAPPLRSASKSGTPRSRGRRSAPLRRAELRTAVPKLDRVTPLRHAP